MGARSTRGCLTPESGRRQSSTASWPSNQRFSGCRLQSCSVIGPTVHAAALGYALGTVPSAVLVSRAAGGPDPRTTGTGNPGAANMASVVGPRAGLVVLAADIGKGAAAGRVGLRLAGALGADVAATAAVIGHCHPVWNGFEGGKGVATSVGQVLSTFPAYFPIDLAIALATSAVPGWKQRAFAAPSVSSVVWIAGSTLWWRRRLPNAWGPPPTASLPAAALVSSVVIARRFLAGGAP